MKISLDISLYPLKEDYRQPILDFIARVEQCEGIEVRRNSMSTILIGEYQQIMSMLTNEMKTTLKQIPQSIFVIKLSGGCF